MSDITASAIQPGMIVTRVCDPDVGTNQDRWVGYVHEVTEAISAHNASGIGYYRAWVTDREWKDVNGAWHSLPDTSIRVELLRSIGGGDPTFEPGGRNEQRTPT